MAGKHSDAGARRPRRFVLSALGVLALVSVGLIVGFAGTGGTYAAWNSTAGVTDTTIKTGSTAIQVSKAATTGFGGSLDLGSQSGAFGPGVTTARAFYVKNTGTTPVALAVTVTVPVPVPPLASALHVTVAAVDASGCTIGLATNATSPLAAYGSGTTLPHVQSGDVQSLCLVLTVPKTDTSSATGQLASFTVNVSGTQAQS